MTSLSLMADRTVSSLCKCVFLFSYIVKDRKFDVTYIINGLLGSLVAITGMVILYIT